MRSVRLPLTKKWVKLFLIAITGLVVISLGDFLFYSISYSGKIYPNISVAGVDLSNTSPQQAFILLSQNIKVPEKIILNGQSQNTEINTKDIDLSYNYQASVERAFNYTRTGNPLYDLENRLKLFRFQVNIGLETEVNEAKLSKVISVIAGQNSVEPVVPSLKFIKGEVQINKGVPGIEIDQALLRARIGQNLSFAKSDNIDIPTINKDLSLTNDETQRLQTRAEKYLNKKIILRFEYKNFDHTTNDLLKTIDLKGGFKDDAISTIISNVSAKINRDPQNPKFAFENGRVSEFLPALDGVKVENNELKEKLTNALVSIENGGTSEESIEIEIPVTKTSPEVTTDKVNNLGIKELIGRGTSTYFHSIPGRVHNVSLAASRINGVLVKPGETFSFNEALGDVSQFTGYQQAYIISGGKTILGDGGGVCQVSTTLFRALLNAGLPITERASHAYRVGYYEQNSPPGMDATVYGPSPDLKFTNDTPGYVLIEATADPKHYSLVFELYGTNDGRVATTSKPVVSNVTPALPTIYQDDPTLPKGVTKQVDFSAAGAKVTFNYIVERAGTTIYKKTFVSNYRPWAAVYLRGTAQ